MDYCGPRGIAHSTFLAWDIDDQAKALGWMSEAGKRCKHCGTAAWEWEGNPEAYEAASRVCLGCLAIGTEQKDKAEHAKAIPGLKTYLRRPDEVEVDRAGTDH
ncbi:hypothetical protein [Streptomyces sp.]|uniref:hypothetical protein n=1 Tax=Streptomyces sp. TaxID=1931 RepID=UPI002F9217B9